ncbi:SET domain-containing protein [Wilcoxina mikolae CBS 423.85]|nr:SET domain-containing protein [Wilcoxina mikolae CBS 423.85]
MFPCAHVAPSSSLDKGNGLFSSATIPAGSSILTISSPLITIPDSAHLPETCSGCMIWKPTSPLPSTTYFSSHTTLLQCTGCKTVKYCHQTCQRVDWEVHKKECRIFARLYPRVLPASVRALIRLLLKRPYLPDATWNTVVTMQSHMTEFGTTENWKDICLMAKGAHHFSGILLPEPVVLRLYCVILVNSLTLTTPTLDPIGICFDPFAANANHSCVPNSYIIFEGRSLNLRSLDVIPKSTEITISYIDTTFPTATRQAELKSRWFFTCACGLCSLAPFGTTDIFSCPYCVGEVPNSPPLTCIGCRKCLPKPPNSDDLKTLYKSRLFPPHRQPLPSLHSAAIESLLCQKNYREVLKHQLLLYTLINPALYPQSHHPIRVCSGFVLAVLLLEASQDLGEELEKIGIDVGKAVWALLAEVEQKVKWSHGEESGLDKMIRMKKTEVDEQLKKANVLWHADAGETAELREELAKAGVVVTGILNELRA